MTATSTPVATWVRIALIAVGIPNVLAGLWAVVDPAGWYERFPGFDPRLVAADPPYNAHLATDAGAGLLASGFVLLAAAWLGDRRCVSFGIVAYLVFAVPHAVWHGLNESPGLTAAEDVRNVGSLAFGVVVTLVLLLVVNRPARGPAEARPSDLRPPGRRR